MSNLDVEQGNIYIHFIVNTHEDVGIKFASIVLNGWKEEEEERNEMEKKHESALAGMQMKF